MKKRSLIGLLMLAVLVGYASICSAENWVMYDKDANAQFYYDADMTYVRDGMGRTPFIQIHLRAAQGRKVLEDRVYRVDPDVRWKEPIGGGNVNIMMMGFEERKSFRPYEWRLVEAIKKWKESHPRR